MYMRHGYVQNAMDEQCMLSMPYNMLCQAANQCVYVLLTSGSAQPLASSAGRPLACQLSVDTRSENVLGRMGLEFERIMRL